VRRTTAAAEAPTAMEAVVVAVVAVATLPTPKAVSSTAERCVRVVVVVVVDDVVVVPLFTVCLQVDEADFRETRPYISITVAIGDSKQTNFSLIHFSLLKRPLPKHVDFVTRVL